MYVGQLVKPRVTNVGAGKCCLERFRRADARRPRIGQQAVGGDVLGVGEHDGGYRRQTARGSDEGPPDRRHHVGLDAADQAHEGGEPHRVLPKQAFARGGEGHVFEGQGLEEIESHVLVSRGDHDVMTLGPKARDRRAEEMHVSGMTDIHQHAHAIADYHVAQSR